MNFDNLFKNLEELIETNIEHLPIPYAKGNSIRIKQYVVRKNKNSYLVYDCKEHKRIAELSFKVSAIALAKTLAENKNHIRQIEMFDSLMLMHYNDVLFYRNIIKKTTDDFVRETRKVRLEVSLHKAQKAKQSLEDFIF